MRRFVPFLPNDINTPYSRPPTLRHYLDLYDGAADIIFNEIRVKSALSSVPLDAIHSEKIIVDGTPTLFQINSLLFGFLNWSLSLEHPQSLVLL